MILFYAFAQLNLLFNYLAARKNTVTGPTFDLDNPARYLMLLYNCLFLTRLM
ncbi:hypothetical protein JCM19298_3403 [Nonlabens ulvanivorans]|nr:hypothetical protein JCM19298_3403 [Nonlabens ulvanivorans]